MRRADADRGQRAAAGTGSPHPAFHAHRGAPILATSAAARRPPTSSSPIAATSASRGAPIPATSASVEGGIARPEAGLSEGEGGEGVSGGEEEVGGLRAAGASGVSKGAVRAAAAAALKERVGTNAAMDRKKNLRSGPASARVCPRTGVSGTGAGSRVQGLGFRV